MSRLQTVKVFVYQRLTAAVEDIMGHLDTVLTEYEEEVESRHRQLLNSVSKPEEKLQTAGEQQEWSRSLHPEDPEDPERLHIKEEQEDFWTSQEEDITNFPFALPVSVKTEDDEEKSQSSQLHQRQTEDRDAGPPASSSAQHMKTEDDGEHCEGSETHLVSHFKCVSRSDDKTSRSSEAVTEHRGDGWKAIRRPQTDLNAMKNNVPVSDMGLYTGNNLFSCSKCGKRFGMKHHLQRHMTCHTGERPFSCSLCDKRFTQKGNLRQHMTVHTREKPCSCPVCGERFSQQGHLTQHMTVHAREKLCS